jgi:Tfp pilus assembly PilM family ATPase
VARYLALDWDQNQLHIVAATTAAGTLRVHNALHLTETQSPNPADAEALGRRLRERLNEAGIRPAPVLACVGRERVILKEIRFPRVPPTEVPAVLRFQAAKELAEPLEEVVLDFALLGDGVSGEQRALTLVLRREMLAAYQRLCQAAGLKLHALVPRPFGILACLRQLQESAAGTDEDVALLTVSERWAELCVARADTLLFARALPTGSMLCGEVRRSLTVYDSQSPQHPVRRLYVAESGEHAALIERLTGMLAVPVESFDPFQGIAPTELPPAGRGSFAAAVGLLRGAARRQPLVVNFVAPKEPKPQRDPNRRRVALAGSLIAAGLLLAIGYGYAQLERQNKQIELLQLEKTSLDRQLVDIEEEAKRIKALEDWTQTEVVWLDELYDLADRIPDTGQLRLVQLTAEPLSLTAKGKNAPRQVARLSLKGITTDNYQLVDSLIGELVADGHYRVEPKQVKRNTGVDRVRFREEFTTRLDVEPRPPAGYVRRLPSASELERQRRERRGREDRNTSFGGFAGE